jgi:SRSO17 transposase
MGLREAHDSESRLTAYVEGLASVIGHGARVQPLGDYCLGLLMSCERKSVEPMAAITAPARASAQHQSLLHFIGKGGWSDEAVLACWCPLTRRPFTKARGRNIPPLSSRS